MNALNFDPASRFIQGKNAGLATQGNQLALQQQQLAAPRQNALADIQLRQAQQGEQTQNRAGGISDESQRVQFLNQFGKAMSQIPAQSRMQAAQMLIPMAQKVGIDPSVFTPERMTDESIKQLLDTTTAFINDPQTLEQQKLDFRNRELAQREELFNLKPKVAGDTEEQKLLGQRRGGKAELEGDISASKENRKLIEGRSQGFIDDGIAAAETLPTINRTLELLDTVKTGGFAAAKLAAAQKFGIEGADEGELAANLGKAILSQMRTTFGAAFTEREGDKLDRIEANFGKSAATNKRLLENIKSVLEREARRGLDSARKSGDDFAVSELESLLDFKLGDDKKEAQPAQNQGAGQIQEGQTATNPQTGQTIVYRNGQWAPQ